MRYHNKSPQKTVPNGGKKSDTTAKYDIIYYYYYYGEHNYANPKKKEKNS